MKPTLCLSLLFALFVGARPAAAALPFIEDDYPRALAEAKRQHKPLFVDSWAPWCHTCRFLRAHVLDDPALGKDAGRFVWLSLDTEKDTSQAFLERYPIRVWPTLLVIDPEREQAVLRWEGAATVPELTRLLDDGARAARPNDAAGETDALVRADRLAASGKPAEAAAAYREALARVPQAQRPRVLESLVFALDRADDHAGCAQLAVAETAERAPLPPPALANVVATGLGCALAADKGAAFRAPALAALAPRAEAALDRPGVLADDRSGLYELLVETREQAGDAAGKRALGLRWLSFLEAEQKRARTVEQRTSFDPHLVLAALAAGEPARAVPALEQSERELPRDYNPPARLALLYRALGRLDDALAASDRALARVYGPRRLRLLETRADLLAQKGDHAAARKTLAEALALAEKLPAARNGAAQAARLRARGHALPLQRPGTIHVPH